MTKDLINRGSRKHTIETIIKVLDTNNNEQVSPEEIRTFALFSVFTGNERSVCVCLFLSV
jgi:hypothetical protein